MVNNSDKINYKFEEFIDLNKLKTVLNNEGGSIVFYSNNVNILLFIISVMLPCYSFGNETCKKTDCKKKT